MKTRFSYTISIIDNENGQSINQEVAPAFFERDATEVGEFIQDLQYKIDPSNKSLDHIFGEDLKNLNKIKI